MARQKFVNVYANGIERTFISSKINEKFGELQSSLMLVDLHRIEVALRLRIEALEGNGEVSQAGYWRGTWRRVQGILAKVESREIKD